MPQQPKQEQQIYDYYQGDNTILRKTHPRMPRLEIYRGNGIWDNYPDIEAWATNSQPISSDTAAKLIARQDAMRREF